MKTPFLVLFLLFNITFYSIGQHSESSYSRAKISLEKTSLTELSKLGIPVDHGDFKKGQSFTSDFSKFELQILKDNSIDFDIVIEDIIQHYQTKEKLFKTSEENPNYPTPNNFKLGSINGFFTYNEMEEHLQKMDSIYPNLIHKDTLPYRTHEKRTVYYYKISDNPDSSEQNEPAILFNSLIHAREPASLSTNIYLMWYLLENYKKNDQIKELINQSEIFFIPCINPDGYIYNETNYPNGGGMWRKNRRDNGDGSYGVDLNRNFGYNWGYNNAGSSSSSYSNTYRGPSAFSEPETQNIKYLCERENFKITFNYHTYGNLLIYPWGYKKSLLTIDSLHFEAFSQQICKHYSCAYGTGDQTVGYVTNGDSDDWMYGDTSNKNKIFSFTPEAGSSSGGFYPSESKIIGICQDMMHQNIMAIKYIHPYIQTKQASSTILTPHTSHLKFNFQKLGLTKSNTYNLNLRCLSNKVTIDSPPAQHTELEDLELFADSFHISINQDIQENEKIQFLLKQSTDSITLTDTFTYYYANENYIGPNTISFSDSEWTLTKEKSFLGNESLHESPNGNYKANEEIITTSESTIDIIKADKAFLSFYATWDVQTNFDYVLVEGKALEKSTWQSLNGINTRKGTPDQDGKPILDGRNHTWEFMEYDLSVLKGNTIDIRISLVSNNSLQRDGIYLSQFKVNQILDPYYSIQDENKLKQTSLFPNPVNNQLTIEQINHSEQGTTLTILNALGQIVWRETIPGSSSSWKIKTSQFQTGNYTVQLKNEMESSITKLMIIH